MGQFLCILTGGRDDMLYRKGKRDIGDSADALGKRQRRKKKRLFPSH